MIWGTLIISMAVGSGFFLNISGTNEGVTARTFSMGVMTITIAIGLAVLGIISEIQKLKEHLSRSSSRTREATVPKNNS